MISIEHDDLLNWGETHISACGKYPCADMQVAMLCGALDGGQFDGGFSAWVAAGFDADIPALNVCPWCKAPISLESKGIVGFKGCTPVRAIAKDDDSGGRSSALVGPRPPWWMEADHD